MASTYAVRRRKHLLSLARKCLRRGTNPVWVVRKYAHILDKQCLRAVLDKVNTVNPVAARALIDGVIPYVPRKWLHDIDPKRTIYTTARFLLPADRIIAGINSSVNPRMYAPLLGKKCGEWSNKYPSAMIAVVVAKYAYRCICANHQIDNLQEFKNLIGMIGRYGTRSMVMRALKIWDERKGALNVSKNAIYLQRDTGFMRHSFDIISGGAVFSLPPKYVIMAMDFIMTDCFARGVVILESAIYRLLDDSPCLHYKVWDFVINRILDAVPYTKGYYYRIITMMHDILKHGSLYARLPRTTATRILENIPAAVESKMFDPRDAAVAKLLTVGHSE